MAGVMVISCKESVGSGSGQVNPDLIFCGAEEVFISSYADPARKLWSWTAEDSPEIPEEKRRQFRTTDECKPYAGGLILITSSSNGVAIIDRKTKSCRFWATATNAHSGCLLPGNLLVVASSFGGDELLVFDRAKSGSDPILRKPLHGAHGVHWECDSKTLWALGDRELVSYRLGKDSSGKVDLHAISRWPLPSSGGHDLSPVAGEKAFFITTDSEVLVFCAASGRFESHPKLGKSGKVKSMDQAQVGGPVVFQQASVEHWWSNEIRFLDGGVARFPEERLYKVRWDSPAKVPE